METINSVAAAAAKVVWGENQSQSQQSSEEPRSGETGDTKKGEPYDAGNLDEPENRVNAPADGVTSKTSSSTLPAQQQQSSAGASDTTAGQNDVRDPENPRTDHKSALMDVDDTGDGPSAAQKLDGPGPKPLEEVARERGGDAGISHTSPAASTTNASGADNKPSSTSLDQKSKGSSEEIEDGSNAKSKSEGSGEKYVKSSGLKIDGGDFDVTKPGAGREADRLMEEKGIHNPNDDTSHSGGGGGAAETESNGSGKKKLSQKIKEKLHRH